MFLIAVLALILAGVFSPQTEVEAKAQDQSRYVFQDVSGWLLRLAAWSPDSSVQAACPPRTIPSSACPGHC
jgi:hypothetical protein